MTIEDRFSKEAEANFAAKLAFSPPGLTGRERCLFQALFTVLEGRLNPEPEPEYCCEAMKGLAEDIGKRGATKWVILSSGNSVDLLFCPGCGEKLISVGK